ncbi:CRISPR-associated endoribonuclease Cas6 [Paenibacillus larvae]|uniref:CRISPR-associated endoribonuclease Cas6 n=1 Tax=Paenibacillus larvae TaxID=1464 RepID=UPI002283107A|nr:CRISPR-associated endoribonuclease Cas6 [Paenibacillus larvae]MCY9512034.1 CRISPR-associated endoribonuclease Cas6 [Paenibacillus larvae]MCY9525783.1 CRISPR-associated endoribonuclease Cas6 [Paenibacillus larvae]
MRIKITLAFEGELVVPFNHQEWIHGLIYHSIRDNEYRDFLHNTGFLQGKRQFRMFTFSKLFGPNRIDRVSHNIEFSPPQVSFIFSAFDRKLVQELASTLLIKNDLRLGKNSVRVESIEQIYESLSDKMHIRFLTPITMYSTFMLNGKKKTYYYSPHEEEFNQLIQANACKKYEAIYGQAPKHNRLVLSPLYTEKLRPRTTHFKSTLIRGWVGDFMLEGDMEMIQLTYDVGLGGKNSNGHGLYEVVRHL